MENFIALKVCCRSPNFQHTRLRRGAGEGGLIIVNDNDRLGIFGDKITAEKKRFRIIFSSSKNFLACKFSTNFLLFPGISCSTSKICEISK